jgi:hypothetical protein
MEEGILVPIAFFAMVTAIVYLLVDKNIKKTLIQHGANAKMLKMDKRSNSALKFGMLLVGVALGILLGDYISKTTLMNTEAAYFSMISLFGGSALVIYHFIVVKSKATKESED